MNNLFEMCWSIPRTYGITRNEPIILDVSVHYLCFYYINRSSFKENSELIWVDYLNVGSI